MAVELENLANQALGVVGLCRAVAEASPLPTAGVEGPRHVIRYVNPLFCVFAGKRKEELIGNDYCAAGCHGNECQALLDRVYRTGQGETQTVQEHGPDDHKNSYAVSPLFSEDHHTLGAMILITETAAFREQTTAINEALLLNAVRQDETAERLVAQVEAETAERKKALDALINAEKLASLGRMAASISHEINNPLEAVTNTLFLAKTAAGMPDPARVYLDIADEELRRIAHITRQTLGFYRESTAPTRFHISSLLDSVLDLLRAKIRAKQATVEKQFDDKLQIIAQYGELRQVISNLVVNSLDAIDEKGRVTLRSSASAYPGGGDYRVRVMVADNGQGIAAEALPSIFEPFFTTKGAIGNGLGLWVSKQIIDKHQGCIAVRSCTNGPRRGTVFSVVLPQAPGRALSD